jgi:hypothetical protein
MQGRTKEVSMRKVIASEYVSLDGVMESPEKWAFPYLNEETRHPGREVSACIRF